MERKFSQGQPTSAKFSQFQQKQIWTERDKKRQKQTEKTNRTETDRNGPKNKKKMDKN